MTETMKAFDKVRIKRVEPANGIPACEYADPKEMIRALTLLEQHIAHKPLREWCIWRGHACQSHVMCPSIFRDEKLAEYLQDMAQRHSHADSTARSRVFGSPVEANIIQDNNISRFMLAWLYKTFEVRHIIDFTAHCNQQLFIETPSSDQSLYARYNIPSAKEFEDSFITEVIQLGRNSPDLDTLPADSNYLYAVHSGALNSSINFSESPLKALWFAASHRKEGRSYPTDYISVFCVSPMFIKLQAPHDLSRSKQSLSLYKPRYHSNARARAQSALIYRIPDLYHDIAFTDTPIQEVAHKSIVDSNAVSRHDIHVCHTDTLLEQLADLGITKGYMMQDPTYIANDLKAQPFDSR